MIISQKMKFLLISLFLAIVATNVECFKTLEELKQKAHYVNSLKTTWKATYENIPSNITLGTFLGFDGIDLGFKDDNEEINDIPEEFDVRKNWPECQEITSHVRDQGSCGSCWAFGAVSTISDRICIASKGQTKVMISAEDLVSCCGIFCGFGCHGGFPSGAFRYWVRHGLVSGGDFGDKNTCRPYEVPECSHHVNGTRPACSGTVSTPKCQRSCVNGADYKKDLHFGAKSYRVRGSVKGIQTEIMQHGSVEAAFTVYDDFPVYKSGVYKSTSSKELGGHAVKILGWGVENGTPYWLVANSWNNEWGDKGLFKILRGKNHCGIESNIVAGLPK